MNEDPMNSRAILAIFEIPWRLTPTSIQYFTSLLFLLFKGIDDDIFWREMRRRE